MEEASKDPFHVVLMGIIFDPAKRKILIGKRENDPFTQKLTWDFPSGRLLHGENPEKKLRQRIKEKTGYDVKNLGTIFSNVFPEKKDLMAVYFLCEVLKGKEKAGDDLKELKWVKPEELERHLTTPFHPELKEYIINLK